MSIRPTIPEIWPIVFDLEKINEKIPIPLKRVSNKISPKSNMVISMARGYSYLVLLWLDGGSHFIVQARNFLLIDATTVTLMWPWIKVTEMSSSKFPQTCTFFVPIMFSSNSFHEFDMKSKSCDRMTADMNYPITHHQMVFTHWGDLISTSLCNSLASFRYPAIFENHMTSLQLRNLSDILCKFSTILIYIQITKQLRELGGSHNESSKFTSLRLLYSRCWYWPSYELSLGHNGTLWPLGDLK